jgi:GAF domain-containing protein
MSENLTLQTTGIPLILFLGYVLLMVAVVAQRRRREAGIFVVYLVVAAVWFLSFTQNGLRAIWPLVPWDRVATCALVVLGIVFLDFARAFLQKRPLPIGGLAGVIVLVFLAALDSGLLALPPMLLTIGATTFTEETLAPLVGVASSVVYAAIASAITLVEYVRRPSPLHRNRIVYWLLGAAALIAGPVLVFAVLQGVYELIGVGVHWLGALLVTCVVVQPQLPNIGTSVRRAFGTFWAALIPAIFVVGLSMVIVYYLDQSPLVYLQFTRSVFFSLIIAGGVAFLLYRPLGSLTRRVANRLLFGRGHEAQVVIRRYSQAVTQTLALEPLVAAAMQTIDDAFGIRKGTLLVVEEKRESGWWLRVLEGLNVVADPSLLVLPAETPLADWLVEQGAPLHQYTLDVDPRFDVLDRVDREAWRRLNMEVFLPIRRSGDLIGLLALGLRRSVRPYSRSDLDLLATIADQTAATLGNASLFDRVQRRAEQLVLLSEIGRVITSSLDMEPLEELIARRIESAFGGAAGFLFLLDEPEGDLVLRSASGCDVPDRAFRVRPGQGLVGWVAAAGRPELVTNLLADGRYARAVEGALVPDAVSALCVPIIVQGKTVGVILVTAESRTLLGSTELNLLDSIASFASIAIENARQVAAREAHLCGQVEALRAEVDALKQTRHGEETAESGPLRGRRARARQPGAERAARDAGQTVLERLQEEMERRAASEAGGSKDVIAAENDKRGG